MNEIKSGPSPSARPSRRDVLVTTLSTRFALAAGPVHASLITTDSEDLEAGAVQIPTASGPLPGYRARPKNPKHKLPVVLVVHEIFGVHEHIQDVCRRLAKAGCFAVAPELIQRHGDVSRLSEIKDVLAVVARVPDHEVLTALDATDEWAQSDASVARDKLALTGFCWGGRVAWLYASHSPRLKTAVAWYGRLDGTRDPLRQRQPVDLIEELRCPVLGLYGAKDQGIPVASVSEVQRMLREAKNPRARASSIHLYADAGHAFFADYRPSYQKEAAEDGWKRLLGWFRKHQLL